MLQSIEKNMQFSWKLLLFMSFTKITLTVTTPSSDKSKDLILTSYIQENRLLQAQVDSKVDPSIFLGIPSHSGFLTVDQKCNSNLFFWYFPITSKQVGETPLIIWLQGGPGATSMAGLFDEIGPFEYDYVNKTLKRRQHSWANEYSLLFIDNPVGTGFSYTDNELGYATNFETYGSHLHSALIQFLTIFSELKSVPLYIAGESYAGRYVPALAHQISLHKDINLQGLIMGNPVLDRNSVVELSSVYYNLGMIDAQGLAAVKPLQDAYRNAVVKNDDIAAIMARDSLIDMLDTLSDASQNFNFLKDKMDFNEFVDNILKHSVSTALHVGSDHLKRHPFLLDNPDVKKHMIPDFLVHITPIIEELLDQYEILIYCGQLDLTAPCTLNSLPRRVSWKWKKREAFMSAPRLSWHFNNSVAGYVKSGGGLTEVLIRGAGHLAPIDKPEATLHLITSFISKTPLYTPSISQRQLKFPLELTFENRTKNDWNIFFILSLILNIVFVVGMVSWFVRRRMIRKRLRNDWLYNEVEEDNALEIV